MTNGNGTQRTKKISISLTPEIYDAVSVLMMRTGLNRSRAIETVLRNDEHIKMYINSLRYERAHGDVSTARGHHNELGEIGVQGRNEEEADA